MDAHTPLATLQRYIDAFNGADVDTMAAIFADKGSILDGMPPHTWLGESATRDWYRDVMAESEHIGAADYFVTLGSPQHYDISGDRAYVVVPATMSFIRHGKAVTQTGASLTVALHDKPGGWRIIAWAWTKGQ